MRALILLIGMFSGLLSSTSKASNDKLGMWNLQGFYGISSVSPTDINNAAAASGANKLSSDMFYGGALGVMLSSHFQLQASYEIHDAKNPYTQANGFTPAGYEALQNNIWGIVNYYFTRSDVVYVYAGAGVGYPIYAHVTSSFSIAKTEYDAVKNLGYIGQVGIGVMAGKHISIFFEGGYQSMAQGTLTTSTGTFLTVNGTNAKMDLSGPRGLAGLGFIF